MLLNKQLTLLINHKAFLYPSTPSCRLCCLDLAALDTAGSREPRSSDDITQRTELVFLAKVQKARLCWSQIDCFLGVHHSYPLGQSGNKKCDRSFQHYYDGGHRRHGGYFDYLGALGNQKSYPESQISCCAKCPSIILYYYSPGICPGEHDVLGAALSADQSRRVSGLQRTTSIASDYIQHLRSPFGWTRHQTFSEAQGVPHILWASGMCHVYAPSAPLEWR